MDRYHEVMESIEEAALKAGRDPSKILLVAVTKTVSWGEAAPIYEAGHRDFGESRVQEALAKMEEAPPDCRWHLIGTLQKNKVKKIVGKCALIHSIDSLELLNYVDQCSAEAGVVSPVLLQVNTSGEKSKHGMSGEECLKHFLEMTRLPNVKIEGLMTMAPFVEEDKVISVCFSTLRILRDRINEMFPEHFIPHLSMGMSHDYKLAIAEGATMIRVGTALFK